MKRAETLANHEEKYNHNASGWIPENLETKLSVPELSTAKMSLILEETIDYTDAFPDPGNQGKQGSCTAWAVAYAAKSYIMNIGQK